jgi:MoaA/NifB/PqqE/SkfB family radical SAM enzyme
MKCKRLEIYLWWTCNKKCIFCNEYSIMEDNWSNKVLEKDILKKLIKYKKLWYNHVTFLWGEPFIQKNFLFSLKIAKKLWYKILVTTNWTTLWIDAQAQKYLYYIDELIISINAIDEKIYKKIHQVNNYLNYNLIFKNIKKYWKWDFLKVNCVLNNYNLDNIKNIIYFISKNWVNEITLTYPDLYIDEYSIEYAKSNILVKYSIIKSYIDIYFYISKKYWIKIKIADIPFCVLEKKKYIENTDEYFYSNRLKISDEWVELDRNKVSPRNRKHIKKCNECKYKYICWWPWVEYIKIYWDSEIIKF